MKEFNDYSKQVADKFIQHLQDGNIPWRRNKITQTNFNPVNGREYNGMNQLALEMESMSKGYDDPRWMTYKQAREMGAYVKEGEHPTRLEFFTKQQRAPVMEADGKTQSRDDLGKLMFVNKPLDKSEVFYVDVFNASQIEGLEEYKAPKRDKMPHEKAEEIIRGFGVTITEGRNPSYNKERDMITLPPKETYKTQEEYYAGVLYELGHATGHKDRMAREIYSRGSEKHSGEELRNELASYFASKDTGMQYNPVKNTPHIKNWIKLIKENPREIFRAARDGMQIKKYLLEPESRERLNKLGQQQNRTRKTPPKEKAKLTLAPAKEFASLLAQMSLTVNNIVPDGKWHNSPEGAYRFHNDKNPNGYVINKEAGMSVFWQPQGREITGADVVRLQAETRASKELNAEIQAEQFERAGKKAYKILQGKPTAEVGDHPYLKSNPKDAIKYDREKGELFVPVNDRWGKPMSYQKIDKDGNERFMQDGQIKGGMLRLGKRDEFETKPVVIATSFKDAQSIREKTGSPTVVAFIPSNVEKAAEAIRRQYPEKDLIFAVGKDEKEKLAPVAEKFGAALVAPGKVKSALKPAKAKKVLEHDL